MTSSPHQLWIPGPLPGLNELISAAKGARGRGVAYALLKRNWTEAVWAEAKSRRVPPFPGRVVIEFRWFERDRRRDPDNVAAGGRKLVLDGLVKAGVLRGDGWRFVQSWTDRFDVSPERPGVAVTIHAYAGAVLMASEPREARSHRQDDRVLLARGQRPARRS